MELNENHEITANTAKGEEEIHQTSNFN